jgi:hypothetical protein
LHIYAAKRVEPLNRVGCVAGYYGRLESACSQRYKFLIRRIDEILSF